MSNGGELFHAGTRLPIAHAKVLVVEGRDIFGFALALLRELQLDGQIEVRNGGGLPAFNDYFQDLALVSGFAGATSLGVIRDCEGDPQAAFQQTCAGLQRAGLSVPTAPLQPTMSPPAPIVNVMLLPDAQTPGMLESLLWRSLVGDVRLPCVDDFLDCIGRVTGQPVRREDKSRVFAYIASRDEPWFQIGQAANAGYFPWTSSVFADLTQFLRSL